MTETDRWGRPPPPIGDVFLTHGRAFRDGDFMIDAAGGRWQLRYEWRTRRRYAARISNWVFVWHSLAAGAQRGPGRPVPPYQYAELTLKKEEPTEPWTSSPDPKGSTPDDLDGSPTTGSSPGSWRLPGGLPPSATPTLDVEGIFGPYLTVDRNIPASTATRATNAPVTDVRS